MKKITILFYFLAISLVSLAQTEKDSTVYYPSTDYPTLGDSTLNINDIFKQNKLNLVVFCGTNGPSAFQIMEYEKVYNKWKEKYEVEIIVISVLRKERMKDAEKYTKSISKYKGKINTPILLDECCIKKEKKTILKYSKSAAQLQGVTVTPFTLLVTENGKILKSLHGGRKTDEVAKYIDDFFK